MDKEMMTNICSMMERVVPYVKEDGSTVSSGTERNLPIETKVNPTSWGVFLQQGWIIVVVFFDLLNGFFFRKNTGSLYTPVFR